MKTLETLNPPAEVHRTASPPPDERLQDTKTSSKLGQGSSHADDVILVERCIRGEVSAWEEIYRKCHDPLCLTIRTRLGRFGNDPHLVDEIAARVWYAVVDDDGKKLTKYDARRGGGILTFLQMIARSEISRYFRTERRRLNRELASLLHKNKHDVGESATTSLSEFLTTLTPHERDFCGKYLRISGAENNRLASISCSTANIWQTTHRIYKKFLYYIGGVRPTNEALSQTDE
jgi:DNA-directed RNA polymerase specialized sigma24 family protein